MTKTTKPQSGNTYWQTDIQTPKGTVRCVIYLHAGALEKELVNPTSNLSMHQKIIGHPIPDDLKENFLAALYARNAAHQFSKQCIDILPTPMLQIEAPPEGKDRIARFAESCEAWAWWHLR